MNRNHLFAFPVLCLAVAQTAQAAVTYVDANVPAATVGNTDVWDTAAFPTIADWVELSGDNNNANSDDDKWLTRGVFGNEGQLFTADDRTGPSRNEDAPVIVTTIDGLVSGQEYAVYAYFWSQAQDWQIRATVDAGEIDNNTTINESKIHTKNSANVSLASDQAFTNSPLVTEADRIMYAAQLGTVIADGGGNISVYIDDAVTETSLERAWYDGVGFELVPEPASLTLVGAAGIGFMTRRRKA